MVMGSPERMLLLRWRVFELHLIILFHRNLLRIIFLLAGAVVALGCQMFASR